MTGAMAWMLLAMPDAMNAPSSSGPAGSMAGMSGTGTSGSGGGRSMGLHGASRTTAVVLLVLFVLLGLWWLSLALDTGRLNPPGPEPDRSGDSALLGRAVDAGCHSAMALGMAVMFLIMV